MRCALGVLLTVAVFIWLAALAQPEDLAVLVVEPASTQVNLTSSRMGSLLLMVSNLGGASAVNVQLSFVASGCAELLDERGVWSSNLTLLLGNVTAGTAKRVLVPLRCRGGSGRVAVSVFADNADPSFTAVRVYAEESENAPVWPYVAGGLVAVTLAACLGCAALRTRRRKSGRREGRAAQSR